MGGGNLSRSLGAFLAHLDAFGLAIVVAAALFPASPPTAEAFTNPSTYLNVWSLRLGPTNPFELAISALVIGWVLRAGFAPTRPSSFDRPLLALGLALCAIQALALPLNLADAKYVQVDLERILVLAAGYVIVTRCIGDAQGLRRFTVMLAGVICLSAGWLVLRYGITGQTNFTTILDRQALLITEDTLLLLLPIALAWGALVDGRLTLWGSFGAILLTAAVFAVDLLSLRRGAVLIIGAGVLVRSLGIGRRRLLLTGGALLLAAGVLVAAGPGQTLLNQARYTATSSLLRTNDASSSQRHAELQSFGRNVNGVDWVIGRGIGVFWRADVRSPVDVAAFGSGENALTRLGWHVYGLDWAYKFGLLGVAMILATAIVLGRRVLSGYRKAKDSGRWLIYSLAICAPPFVLLAFTNPRIALMGGVVVGLLSRCCDLLPATASHSDRVA